MPTFRTATVTEVLSAPRPAACVAVAMADGSPARPTPWSSLVGECAVGDEVVLNTTAVELGLGTGGWHVVHWNLSRRELVAPAPTTS